MSGDQAVHATVVGARARGAVALESRTLGTGALGAIAPGAGTLGAGTLGGGTLRAGALGAIAPGAITPGAGTLGGGSLRAGALRAGALRTGALGAGALGAGALGARTLGAVSVLLGCCALPTPAQHPFVSDISPCSTFMLVCIGPVYVFMNRNMNIYQSYVFTSSTTPLSMEAVLPVWTRFPAQSGDVLQPGLPDLATSCNIWQHCMEATLTLSPSGSMPHPMTHPHNDSVTTVLSWWPLSAAPSWLLGIMLLCYPHGTYQ